MKIKYKFFLAFLVTSLTLTALAALIFYHVTKGYFEFQLNQQLRSLTQAKVDSVDVYLRTQRDLISSAVLFLDLPQLLSGSATASELQGTKRSLELLMNNGASNIYAIYIIDDQNRHCFKY
jgi:hypothetical protein